MKFSPTNDLLVVRLLTPPVPVSAGGIILPADEECQDTPFKGEVIYAGKGKPCTLQPAARDLVAALESLVEACESLASTGQGMANAMAKSSIENAKDALDRHRTITPLIPMSVFVGDKILFSRNGHQLFRINGEDLIVFQEASVIG